MTRACHGPVRAATGDAFSDEEINDILERLERRFRTRKGASPGIDDKAAMAEAAAAMTKDQVEEALQLRRLHAAAQRAKGVRTERLATLTAGGLDEAEALRAFNVGTEKQVGFGAASVDAEARARSVALWGDVERGLAQHPGLQDRLVSFFGGGDDAFDREVAREMARLNGADIEASADPDALKAAQVFTAALEKNRQQLNAQGAFVGRLTGRVAQQQHDRLKVAGGFWREFRAKGAAAAADWKGARLAASRRAFREWRDFIRPKLDEATWRGIDPEDAASADEARALAAAGVIDDAEDLVERFLYRSWWNIVSGANEVSAGASELGEFRPPPGKARAVSKHRVLHFQSPDDWMDYHARFGRGSLYSVIMGELERGGRNAALMARWGPAPDAAFEQAVGELAAQARARGDDGAAKALEATIRRAEFQELTGESNRPDNLRLAIIGRTIRTTQVLSKLGGMVLSALSDTSLASQTAARAGLRFTDGYKAAFKGITRLQDAEGRRAADLLDVGARSAAAHLTGRFTATDGPLGWAAWAQRVFYRVNLFEAWSDGFRRGVAEMVSAHWGAEAARPWAALEAGTRETFERYGISPAHWDAVRRHVTPLGDGRTYFTTETVDALSHAEVADLAGLKGKKATKAAVEAARDELRLRFQTMVGGILDDSLTEARARERVGLSRGVKAGTILGEAIRTFTQFWSFSAALMGRHVAPAMRGYAGRQPVALMAHLIVGTTLMGFASMQAKQLFKGRTPRPLFDEEGRPTGAWAAALLQGGGLGIYGDFLFGEYARNGLPATLSSFAGPAVSELERLRLVVGAAAGTLNPLTQPADREEARDTLEQQGFRFLKDNTPFANLFYTRLALDYLVLWRLQEAVSPGYLQRYEQAVEEREHSGFLVRPSEAVR